MSIVKLNNGLAFEAKEGQSIVDAALSAELFFPYSCKTGRCNSCKCKVLNGKTQVLLEETGLTEAEKREGWILGCSRTASEDVVLDDVDVFPFKLPVAKTLPCRIASLEKLTEDVLRVVLRLPPTQSLVWLAGQYIDVIKEGARRSYSIANSMHGAGGSHQLELHIKRLEGGWMSEYWFKQSKVNDLLRLHGPLGTFFLRDVAGKDLFFLATGTGFAPVKAILEQLETSFTNLNPRSVSVYRGAQDTAKIYCDLPNVSFALNYVPVLSRAGEGWSGSRGHVQDVLLSHGADLQNAMVYACGSDAMIAGAKTLLVNAGLDASRFFSDAFVCSASH